MREREGRTRGLVIERGKSVGKEFLLGSAESHIGRWDADGGIFPDVDLDSDDPEAKVSRRHARITLHDGQVFRGRPGFDQRHICQSRQKADRRELVSR